MSEPPRSLIGIRTAFALYAVLAALALLTLKGNFRILALVIVVGLAAKSYVDHLRRNL
jgi:hypothetical protein